MQTILVLTMIIDESKSSKIAEDTHDANSRVLIYALENGSTPDVARLGNISYNPITHGAIIAMGNQEISITPVGITSQTLDNSFNIPTINHIYPKVLLDILLNNGPGIGCRYDCRQMADMLKLREIDYDTLSSKDGPVVRVVNDSLIPYVLGMLPGFEVPLIALRDSEGKLIEYDYYDGEVVFAMKLFKFVSFPSMFCLPFRRERPGIALQRMPPNPWILDTDIKTVLANQNMTWLNDRGDLDKMDWEEVRGQKPRIVWHDKKNSIESNASLKHIFSIVAAAKKNGITLNVIRASCETGQWEEAHEEVIMGLDELRAEAVNRDIELPEPLRESKYMLTLDANPMIDTGKLKKRWPEGAVTGFYPAEGVNTEELLQEVLKEVPESVPVLLLIPKSKTIQVGSAIGGVLCADIEALNDFPELKRIVREYKTALILAVCDAECQGMQLQTKAVEASRELLQPVGVILKSPPPDSPSVPYDNMFAGQRDSNAFVFIPKPEKTKKCSQYMRSGTSC